THGNGTGIGFADVTTKRVANAIDWEVTYMNGITSGSFGMRRNHLPITMNNDFQTLSVALRGCGQPQETAKFVFIQDTLTLNRLWISPSLYSVADVHPRLTVVDEIPLAFDECGTMTSPWALK
ncbi:MAG: hypothetical protein KDE50_16105, partial [Caldilineaceae bacterium]|nr:hypothetical protein [Caldilineaceae bacterium]